MKFSCSLLKRLLPRVPRVEQLAETLNTHLFEVESAENGVLDINLPPNRYSDAASHIGIAREISAIFRIPFKSPAQALVNIPAGRGLVDVEVEKEGRKLCPRYAARVFEIKRVGESPAWMQQALLSCGLKPINRIVDIMNYVMIETGQPLHAFDAAKIGTSSSFKGNRGKANKGQAARKIIVRRARKGETIETLDGQRITLNPAVLVIADVDHAVAIAGIKGGMDSGVTGRTRRIIVEAANFDAPSVWIASKQLKLPTDAAMRFGRGMSPALVDVGLDRATVLLKKTGAKLVDSVDVYPRPQGEEVIAFDTEHYEQFVGARVSQREARDVLGRLGFAVEAAEKPARGFLVRVPPARVDIENFEDLAEEVARVKGYNRLRPQPPVVSIVPALEDDAFVLAELVRRILVGMRIDEVYNTSFLGVSDLEGLGDGRIWSSAPARLVEVANPITEDKQWLRPSIVPLLRKNIYENARFLDEIRIFEVGKVFRRGGDARGSDADERLSLGVALARKNTPKLILELKGIVDELIRGCDVPEFTFNTIGGAVRIEAGAEVIGELFPMRLEKRWDAAFAEIDLAKVMRLAEGEREFKPLPRFPAIMRDISVLVAPQERIGDIAEFISGQAGTIEDVRLIDEYISAKLGGKQSLTFRIVFQAEDRTLTDAEVNRQVGEIAAALKKRFSAEIR